MTQKYDAYYAEGPDALGPPTAKLVSFLTGALPPGAHVLDVGCGQGRDAIWLARAGHSVVGVDPSSVGIAQLRDAAKAQALPIRAELGDLTDFDPGETFDCALFDRTLHMLGKAEREAGLAQLAGYVRPGGLVVILDEGANMGGLIAALGPGWSPVWGDKTSAALRRAEA